MARSKTDLWTDDGHLAVNARVSIPVAELEIRASRAGGTGGQHVNTSSTRVEVTWGALESGAAAARRIAQRDGVTRKEAA